MPVHEHPWDLHKEGSKDASRHQDKIKKVLKERMKDVVSNENIITGDGSKKVRLPVRSTDSYRIIFNQKKQDHVGQGDGDIQEGDIVAQEPKPGKGDEAGDADGDDIYEVEASINELVDLMLEDLELPRLDPKRKSDITVPETVWNDVAKKGPFSNLHKKRTIMEVMKRNAQETGKAFFGNIKDDDLRFRSWNTQYKPVTSAVIIAMMDVSGSMSETKKYVARSFYFWMVQFLRRKYEHVEIVFITHTNTAKIVDEDQFFHTMESGGTICSSAYIKALEVIKNKYDPAMWNIFAFHFSDGDTYGEDIEASIKGLEDLTKKCNMVGYGEIRIDEYDYYNSFGGGYETTTLFKHFKRIKEPNFISHSIETKSGVWDALKKFFGEEK